MVTWLIRLEAILAGASPLPFTGGAVALLVCVWINSARPPAHSARLPATTANRFIARLLFGKRYGIGQVDMPRLCVLAEAHQAQLPWAGAEQQAAIAAQ